jgi:hypothetical protein
MAYLFCCEWNILFVTITNLLNFLLTWVIAPASTHGASLWDPRVQIEMSLSDLVRLGVDISSSLLFLNLSFHSFISVFLMFRVRLCFLILIQFSPEKIPRFLSGKSFSCFSIFLNFLTSSFVSRSFLFYFARPS